MTGRELRAHREALNMTQAELGDALGYSENTVSRWERGELKMRNPKTIEAALKGLRRRRGSPVRQITKPAVR